MSVCYFTGYRIVKRERVEKRDLFLICSWGCEMSHTRFFFLKKSEKEKTNQCRTSNILAAQFIELTFSGFNNFMNSFICDFLMVLLCQFRFQIKSGQAAFFFFFHEQKTNKCATHRKTKFNDDLIYM